MSHYQKSTLEECNKRDYGCGLCPHIDKLCYACAWEAAGKIESERQKKIAETNS